MKYEECCYNCKNVGSKECVSEIYGYDIKSQHCEGYVLRDELAKIESGTLVELPCKVGDTAYLVYTPDQKQPIAFIVDRVELYLSKKNWRLFVYSDNGHGGLYGYRRQETGDVWYIGKDKKVAEARLKELQEKKK